MAAWTKQQYWMLRRSPRHQHGLPQRFVGQYNCSRSQTTYHLPTHALVIQIRKLRRC